MYLDNEDLKRLIQIQDVEQAINSMNNRVAIERGKINRMCWLVAYCRGDISAARFSAGPWAG